MLNRTIYRYTLVLVICFVTANVMAQDFPIEPPATTDTAKQQVLTDSNKRNGLYFNPVLSGGIGVPYRGGFNLGPNINVGGELCYMVFPNVGISIGAAFEHYGYSFHYTSDPPTDKYSMVFTDMKSAATDSSFVAGYTSDINYNFNFIKVPVLIRCVSNPPGQIGFYGEIGVAAELLINAEASGTASEDQYELQQAANTGYYSYSSTVPNSISVNESTMDVTRFNIALHIGLGATFPVSNNIEIIAEYSPEFWLMNSGTGNNDVVNFSDAKYYFYGTGNYGSFTTQSFTVKAVIKM